jgi:hypothetical protein
MIPDTGSLVEYKSWMPVDGGGSETLSLTLPLGATEEMTDAAIRQWQNMRAKALPALREAIQAAAVQATVEANLPIPEMKLPFGKYTGNTFGWIYNTDVGYLDWMVNKSDPKRIEAIWRERAKFMLDNPPSASYTKTDEADENLPF